MKNKGRFNKSFGQKKCPYLKSNNYMCKILTQLRKFPHLNIPAQEGVNCNKNIRLLKKAIEPNEFSINKLSGTQTKMDRKTRIEHPYQSYNESLISIVSPCKLTKRNKFNWRENILIKSRRLTSPLTCDASSVVRHCFNKTFLTIDRRFVLEELNDDLNKATEKNNQIFAIKIGKKKKSLII